MSRHTPYLFLSTVLLLTASACAGDDASSGSASESSGSTTSAADDGPALGERASQLCRDAMAAWPALVAATNTSELAAAYEGGPLQDYVLASDAAGERGDDAAILAALADGGDEARASVVPRLQAAFVARVRAELAAPEALVDDPDAAWSEAHCLWTGALASLAADAGEPGLAQSIDAAFADGHDGIAGAPGAASVDDWKTPPARQVIEKSLFTAAHRRVLAEAALAASGDRSAARRALELFQILEDRLEGRNTPGIALVEGMLGDPGATIDVDAIATAMNIAFAKRTRKYCSDAIDSGLLGVPAGYEGALEGRTYQRLIDPDMSARIAGQGFDAAAYAGAWDDFVDAVQIGDAAAAASLSAELVQWNCAYQAALGIAACTASDDELAP